MIYLNNQTLAMVPSEAGVPHAGALVAQPDVPKMQNADGGRRSSRRYSVVSYSPILKNTALASHKRSPRTVFL